MSNRNVEEAAYDRLSSRSRWDAKARPEFQGGLEAGEVEAAAGQKRSAHAISVEGLRQ